MTNETIEDIIAEMRGIRVREFQDYADRLEAAHKREVREAVTDCNQFNDAAKLREALKLCVDEMCDRCRDLSVARGNPLPCLSGCETVRKAKAALAAPPRNCDVGVPEERIQRWSKFCKARSKKLPPIHGFEWEDYPYKEGDAK